jgi:hypothetical protein
VSGIWLIAALCCMLPLAYAFAVGRMPSKSYFYDRKREPFWFWLQGLAWTGFALICVWEWFRS